MMRWLIVTLVALLAGEGVAGTGPRVAIIIDDLGYQLEAGRRAIALPGPVSYAILPETPLSRRLARSAHDNGKVVLLHLPLQAIDYDGPEEPGGITLDMSRASFRSTFASAMNSVPFAAGVSSHRGSLLTRHPGHMSWLMEEIRAREGLFFIDSYTTVESVALKIAREAGIRAAKRDVFLDHDPAADAVRYEFERLKTLARRQGAAVGIGHPYPATLELLERELPGLRAEGIELVSINDLLGYPAAWQHASAPTLRRGNASH